MFRFLALILILLAALVIGVSVLHSDSNSASTKAQVTFLPNISLPAMGFARVVSPRDWQFPTDYGPHNDFQSEWWYYTGNLETETGQHFGFQFTIFRRAVAAINPNSPSEWRTNQAYMAHFTVTDVQGQQFYEAERISRGGADLAGATTDPVYRVWLDNWQVLALNDDATLTTIQAADNGFAVNLQLEQTKPPALQGDHGLSLKAAEPGKASYYYSLTRLTTAGTITIGSETFAVSGASWMDHEFGTNSYGADMQGWDWFGLQLDDNRELMLGQIRLIQGGLDPVYNGLLINADGTTRLLASSDFSITPTGTWTSPHTGTEYPSGWEIVVNIGEATPLHLTLMPLLPDQELHKGIIYWEGAVHISGDATGYGYAELVGYREAMGGLF